MIKRWSSLLLAVLAMVLVFTACANNAEPGEGQAANGKNEQPSNAAKSNKQADTDEKEKLDLHWFTIVEQATSVLPDAKDDFVKQVIEEKFNVNLHMTYMPMGEDRKKKLNLQLASRDVPDMFLTDGSTSHQYALQGILADMTPFVSPESMPNYFKWVTERELELYEIENAYIRAPIPFEKAVYRSYYIRQDWLDKLGLQIPQSYEEFVEVLKAFTYDDPDGNKQQDTYGFSASAMGRGIPYDFPQWYNNGLYHGTVIDDDKMYRDNRSDPLLGKIVDEVLDMLQLGVVDPDWFLSKGLSHVDKAAQGKIGIVVGNTKDFAFDSNPNSLQSKTKAIIPEAEWTAFNPIPDKKMWRAGLPGNAFLFAKTVAKSHPEKIQRTVEILDWLASEEGYLLTHYGQEGKHYTREGNKITLNMDTYQSDIVAKGNFLDVYSFFTRAEPDALGLEIVNPDMSDRDRAIIETMKGYKHDTEFKGVNISPPEGFNLSDFRTKLSEYTQMMLFDDKSGENWPEYREAIMTEYGGRQLFEEYVVQIRAAGYEIKGFE